MADFRNAYFSFHYADVVMASQIRKSDVCFDRKSFGDWPEWESMKRPSRLEIEKWIRQEMKGSSVTVVLIGAETASREWVNFEIAESVREKKGLVGIYIDQLIGFDAKHKLPRLRGQNPFKRHPPRPATATRNALAALLVNRPSRAGGLLSDVGLESTTTQRNALAGLLAGGGLLGMGAANPKPPPSLGILGAGLQIPPRPPPTPLGLFGRGAMASGVSGRTLEDEVKCYCWKRDDGYNNVGRWIESAARAVGR